MRLFTFTANSPALALKKAQNACGKDALVVSTKQIRKKTLSNDALYELVVAVEDSVPSEVKKEEVKPTFDEDILYNISKTAEQLSKIDTLSTPLNNSQTPHEKSSIDRIKEEVKNNELTNLKNEISTLSDKIKILQSMLWDETKSAKEIAIPPEFAEIYKITKESGIKKEHLDDIMYQTIQHMPNYMREKNQTINRYFHVLLKKMIPTKVEQKIENGKRKIMMFVGPTGVGKTTTLAKLAAKYSFLKYKNRVGIITLDTYRIGALEQLFQYAKMLKLPIEDATDGVDFQNALNALSGCELILIDTAGSSPHDKKRIEQLATMVNSTNYEIDISLVLAASSKLEDLEDSYKNFSFLKIDNLIITKMDESKRFGNVFSLIVDTQKPVSYFSVGQEVPDDLEVASGDFLVNSIFEGFTDKVYS